eukprot:TRINITY_DN8224_c0_g2_i1.p1 TRINITY_DN8224_c0_g2~~TRINITY_DN8224_c0_g2_i1.p1  ORF type:complete len:309 (+),score=75.68 TRINITY_DN8224_c0_g2_i1:179-1105(+)
MEVLSRAAGRVHSQGSGFSLGWGDNAAANEGTDQRSMARRGAPQNAMSKEAYAAALRDQIAAKRSGGYSGIVGGGYGSGVTGAATGGASEMRRSSSFAAAAQANLGLGNAATPGMDNLGGGSVANDTNIKANAYAQELRAQIEARATERTAARQNRISAELEENQRIQREANAYQDQVQQQRNSQAERSRVAQERTDSLQRFLDERGQAPKYGAVAAEGGAAMPPPAAAERPRVRFEEPAPASQIAASGYGGGGGGGGVLPGQAPGGGVSANRFANGGNQNCGNVLTDRPTSRVLAPPGGRSSFSLAW